MKLKEATIRILVKLGLVLPTEPFIREWVMLEVEQNQELFDRLAKS